MKSSAGDRFEILGQRRLGRSQNLWDLARKHDPGAELLNLVQQSKLGCEQKRRCVDDQAAGSDGRSKSFAIMSRSDVAATQKKWRIERACLSSPHLLVKGPVKVTGPFQRPAVEEKMKRDLQIEPTGPQFVKDALLLFPVVLKPRQHLVDRLDRPSFGLVLRKGLNFWQQSALGFG
ncbi:hypothetical protein U8P80_34990 (plasmid) [Rhizobium beringeri]|nr:hypothetical protein U8P80_34990 [Rhizobium beringeri]WSH18575.1 hypothetical protein U8P74_34990 [Rhizobium beringeri]